MKRLIWKFRYAMHFYKRIGGDSWHDWKLAWDSAWVSLYDLGDLDNDPIDSADEELSNWTE